MRLLDLAVGVDDAQRVLPGVEPRDLQHHRPRRVDAELLDDVRGVLGRQRHVLRRQGVDRRRPDDRLVKTRPARHVLVHVKDGGVVGRDRRQQEVEHLAVGRREVDVASPHPLCVAAGEQRAKRGRLRVVHDHHVPLVRVRQLVGVQLVVLQEDLFLLGSEALLVALQRVVNRFGDVEELVAALDHAPLGLDADVVQQRYQRVLDLRDPASERRRDRCRNRRPRSGSASSRISSARCRPTIEA